MPKSLCSVLDGLSAGICEACEVGGSLLDEAFGRSEVVSTAPRPVNVLKDVPPSARPVIDLAVARASPEKECAAVTL